ncbi:MAG: sodium:calcium antiporter [Chloroflexi bacterium]|nr:MAG: sodium:calcium antiporter [Chloroflexota bacterium]
MILVWTKFLVCALIVIFSGTKLTQYGDAIAEKTGLTRAWIGLLLLAAMTSMPELVTGASAAALVRVPDLAIGVVLGSNLFNLLLVVVLDLLHRPGPFLTRAGRSNLLLARLSALLIGLAGLGLLMGNLVPSLALGWLSPFSLVLVLLYLLSLRWLFRLEQSRQVSPAPGTQLLRYQYLSSRRTYLSFALAGAVIIGAGIWLASIGDEIAQITGWGDSFIGNILLAIITSLPELSVCIAALRLGAADMALADLLGSNLFNTGVIIAAADLLYWENPIFRSASLGQLWAVGIALLMTGFVALGLILSSRRKLLGIFDWESFLLLALYVLGAYGLFVTTSG